MPKQYFVQDKAGSRGLIAAPQPSGPQIHYVDMGPTLGRVLAYSGAVTGNIVYYVDNGPTLGRQKSTT